MHEDTINIVIRQGTKEDHPFIYSSWRNSSYYFANGEGYSKESAKAFFSAKTKYIKMILSKANVYIACLDQDPTTIIGYSVISNDHLDWVYVKAEFRNRKIGTMLAKECTTYTDDLTKIGAIIVKKKNLLIKGE